MEFLAANWKYIVLIVVEIIVIIIELCRKNKTVDSVFTIILSALPTIIKEAETRYGSGNGDEKFCFVISTLTCYLKDKVGLDDVTIQSYLPRIKEEIESILATPQKKGCDTDGEN